MDSQSVCSTVLLPFESIIEEHQIVLNHFENEDAIRNFISFEMIDSKVIKNQNDILLK